MSLEIIVNFIVPGIPVAKGRARSRIARTASGQNFVQHYTPAETKKYEKQVAIEAKIAMRGRQLVRGAVCIVVRAYYPIPSSWPQWRKHDARVGLLVPEVKPDWDNIGKACSDAMNGVVYHDDVAVVSGTVHKRYSIDPRVEIKVFAFRPDAILYGDDAIDAIEEIAADGAI